MINVIAVLTAQPGRRDELLALFRDVVPKVREEAGCIEYRPTIPTGHEIANADFGPDSFIVIEAWESREALSAHSRAPHMAEYAAKARPLIAGRTIHVLQDA